MKYIIEINVPKEITENNIDKFSEGLKDYLDKMITYGLTFESFDNMVTREEMLYRHAPNPVTRITYVDLKNSIGGKFINYDLSPEIQSFFVEISIPDDADFYSKGKFIPRILWNDSDMKIFALDYVKKTR